MSNRAGAFSTLAGVMALALPVHSQSVISTHSGVIHFFEGAVFLGDRPLESHLGRFQSMPQGAELRTADGRAEVLLTPGVFLRIGERSAIRMVANDLADTQVELQTGSAIVDSGDPNPGTSVTLIYKDWRVHILQKGVYRINSDPPCMWVRQGQAEVFSGASDEPVSVERGMSLPFAEVLVPERPTQQPNDALNDWAIGRGESILADNAITAQIGEDPASVAPGFDGFTNFPFLGLPAVGLVSPGASYSSYNPYQPGFNSIYLPGFTSRPLILGLVVRGLRTYVPASPLRIGGVGGSPRVGFAPGSGIITPIPHMPPPRLPAPRPMPVHPVSPGGGVHVGAHR
jgi:hypothetical protein